MAMQQYIGASSSSSSMVTSLKKFDVFISFRGEDTRRKFTSHLYEALSKKVLTFIDDNELERGDEISSALIKAIEESDVSIVIFSKHYASSKWCLNELLKILECKKDQGQSVIPVFYEIEPSHVRNQIGSYKQAFEKHEQNLRHNKDKLQKWKDALTEAANLSGWDSQNYRMESNFIKDILEDVLKKLKRRHPFEVNKELVGIKRKYEKTKSLMKIGSKDVRTLGLWGMGGIGKSTLAKHLYAKLCPQFDRHCFFENVREESTRYGLNVVRHKLFSTLSELYPETLHAETPIFINRLAHERSLIVLDDVATLEQAENLNIVNTCLGEGSRIIITTRDKQICSQFDECEIYEVKGLRKNESLQLFCRKAFGTKLPKVGYEYLSKMAILYCRGNPLALKVLGANFRTKKSKEVWQSELEKLKKIPNGRTYDVLKLSFDDLDPTQQDIFLDIACISDTQTTIYFRDKYYLGDVWNACNFFAESGLEVLTYKALIYFWESEINMHELLEEMGKEIVKKESAKYPGRRSRLWDSKEVYEVLKYKRGTEAVEVIEFDTSNIEDLYLSSDSFKNMTNLRYLHISPNAIKLQYKLYNVHLLEGLEWLSDKLRHLYWSLFPLESLPTTFCTEWLVQLSMKYSKLKKLWDGIQRLDNLIYLILDYSKDLIEIPDLSRAPNLQVVSFSYCESLCQLHPSIFGIPKLIHLSLRGCRKIESLKSNIHSKSLENLDLMDCSSLVEFSVTSEVMTELNLGGTNIHEFSLSIWRTQRNSSKLRLNNCHNLEALTDSIQNNSMLRSLILYECWKLKSLPNLPATLQTFLASNCISLNTNSIQKSTLENMLNRDHSKINNSNGSRTIDNYSFYPGALVPSEFGFRTTKASIVIPPIQKSGLCGFVFCIIFSDGVDIDLYSTHCIIYEHTTKAVGKYLVSFGSEALSSDHVLLCRCGYYNSNLVKVGNEREGDHYKFSFEFKSRRKHGVLSAEGIKGCGVIPVYDFKQSFVLDGRIRSRAEIVELQSNAQIYDESNQHSEFDTDELQSSAELSDDPYQYSEFDIDDLQSSAQISDDSDQHSEFDNDEFQSSAELSDDPYQYSESDIDELQHRSIGDEVRFSTNKNEDDQQQLLIPSTEKMEELNDKSSCSCSIGILLKHMLEESKRLFLLFIKQR